MKYKVGDRVRIKEDISGCTLRDSGGRMNKWQGEIMTIRAIECSSYKMEEDKKCTGHLTCTPGWCWYEDMIEGLAGPTNSEIMQQAIDTFGVDNQIRMCVEEMAGLTVAFNKLHRYGYSASENVIEEIADVSIMLQQMKMIFGEKRINWAITKKLKQLQEKLDNEKLVEVVFGVHQIGGKEYTWINPYEHTVQVGSLVTAETKYGELPILVIGTQKAKVKDVKHHKKITKGAQR